MTAESNNQKHDLYIRLLMSNQGKIYTYIHLFVPNDQDADDLMQETASTLWEKFDTFEQGTDFASWAVTIARFKILNYRRRNKNALIQYSSQTVEAIGAYAAEQVRQELPAKDYLRECLEKLSAQDRSLIQMRYAQSVTVKALAKRLGRSPHGLYSSLSRILLVLMDCMKQRYIAEERQ